MPSGPFPHSHEFPYSCSSVSSRYVKFMKAIEKKGVEWVAQETARVQGYLSEKKVEAKKIDELSVRLNILAAFTKS